MHTQKESHCLPKSLHQRESYSLAKSPHQKLDWSQISPYDVIQMKNCKLFKFRKSEMYPSIRPPVSQCDPDETAAWLSASMEANGLGGFDPKLLKKSASVDVLNSHLNKTQEQLYKTEGKPHMVLDWSKITPCDLMRLQNCKAFDFQKRERYPSIKPPVSLCDPEWTAEWLANAVEDQGCRKLFNMENDDVVEIWKQSPQKDTLGFYGVGSDIQTPEAVQYNQVVSKCLRKVRPSKLKNRNNVSNIYTFSQKPPKASRNLILNRCLLESKLAEMPKVQQNLHPSTALRWLHCPNSIYNPFEKTQHGFKTVYQGKFAARRNQNYSNLKYEIPEKRCTEFEWMTNEQDPNLNDEKFKREMKLLERVLDNEPKSYDELYSQLVSCFENEYNRDPLSESYYKCCQQYLKNKEQFGFTANDGASGGALGEGFGGGYGDERDQLGGDKANDAKNLGVNFGHLGLALSSSEIFREGGAEAEELGTGDAGLGRPGDISSKGLGPGGASSKALGATNSKALELGVTSSKALELKAASSKALEIGGASSKTLGLEKTSSGNLRAGGAKSEGFGAAASSRVEVKKMRGKSNSRVPVKGDRSFKMGAADHGDIKKKKKGEAKTEKAAGVNHVGNVLGKVSKSKKESIKKTNVKTKTKATTSLNDIDIMEHRFPTEDRESTETLVLHKSLGKLREFSSDFPRGSLSLFWKKPSSDTGDEKRKGKRRKTKDTSVKGGSRRGGVLKGKSIEKRGKGKHQKEVSCEEPVLKEKAKDPNEDCPCEICESLYQRESDAPFIVQMLREQKQRQLIEYHQRLCRKANELWQPPNNLAPQHKCDDIECEENFNLNPKIAQLFDCLNALKELQKLLCPKHDNDKYQVFFKVQNLKDRLCWRLNQLL